MAMENDGEPNIFVSMTEKGLDTSQLYKGVDIVSGRWFSVEFLRMLVLLVQVPLLINPKFCTEIV